MVAILRTFLYEKRYVLLAWTLGALLMVWVTMIFFPSFSRGQLNQALHSLPPQLQSLVGTADFSTIGGYIDGIVFNLRVPLLTIVMAIIFAIGLTAGDEERGTLATLLAQPVSRGQVLWQKYVALTVSVLILHVAILIGLVLSLLAIGDSYSFGLLAAVTFGCFLLTMVFGSLAFLLGIATGKKSLSTGIVSVLAFASLIFDTMAPSVHAMQTAEKFLPYYYFTSPNIAANGLDWSYVIVQLFILAAMVVLGWSVFRHRDVEV